MRSPKGLAEAQADLDEQQDPGQPTEAAQDNVTGAPMQQKAGGAPPPPPLPAAAKPSSAGPLLVMAALAATAGAAAFLLLRRLRGQRQGEGDRAQRVPVTKAQVVAAVLALEAPSTVLPPPPGAALGGRTLMLSDRLDVQSLETRFGCEAWKEGRGPAEATYWPADALVAAGARGTATVFGEALGLGPLLTLDGAGTPNPAGRGRTHGGGDYGAAVAVAAGLSDLALAVDELGTARVPAACCGAYALRTTAGLLPLEGASTASHSLAAPALLAADPAVLLRAGAALRLPGGGAATEVPQYLVAEDLFAACGQEARAMVPAVVAAVKRWAGPDQAQALSLCEWLFHRVDALPGFMPQGSAAGPRERRSEGVLCALAAAAEAIRAHEFCSKHGAWVEEHAGALPPAVADFWRQARQVDEARYHAARGLAAELQAAMKDALAGGYIFVLPTTPGPAPPTSAAAAPACGASGGSNKDAAPAAAEQAAAAFAQRCAQFSAVASLSGVPQVVLPLPVPGRLPLSVSLVALHKRDQALLQVAAKLGPMLVQEAEALAQQQRQQQQQKGRRRRGGGEAAEAAKPWQPQAGAAAAQARAASSSNTGSSSASPSRGGDKRAAGGSSSKAAAAAEDPNAAAAEALKGEGNAAFRAGRYEDAARQYSGALGLAPRSAVLYANRAMAYLKLGSYSAAEADCDQALALDAYSAKALLRRGSARLAQGNAEGAQADFRQVLALEPNNRQAREELRGLQALQGDGSGSGAAVWA